MLYAIIPVYDDCEQQNEVYSSMITSTEDAAREFCQNWNKPNPPSVGFNDAKFYVWKCIGDAEADQELWIDVSHHDALVFWVVRRAGPNIVRVMVDEFYPEGIFNSND